MAQLQGAMEEAFQQIKRLELNLDSESEDIDEQVIAQLEEATPLRTDICRVFGDVLRYSPETSLDAFRTFFETCGRWTEHWEVGTKSAEDPGSDAIRLFLIELILHLTAVALSERKLGAISRLFVEPIIVESEDTVVKMDVRCFVGGHVHQIECVREKRHKAEGLQHEGLLCDLLKKRATDEREWSRLIEAEVFLWLLQCTIDERVWEPRVMASMPGNKPCKTFARAHLDEGLMTDVVLFFGMDLEELKQKAEEHTQKLNSRHASRGGPWTKYQWYWDRILGIETYPR